MLFLKQVKCEAIMSFVKPKNLAGSLFFSLVAIINFWVFAKFNLNYNQFGFYINIICAVSLFFIMLSNISVSYYKKLYLIQPYFLIPAIIPLFVGIIPKSVFDQFWFYILHYMLFMLLFSFHNYNYKNNQYDDINISSWICLTLYGAILFYFNYLNNHLQNYCAMVIFSNTLIAREKNNINSVSDKIFHGLYVICLPIIMCGLLYYINIAQFSDGKLTDIFHISLSLVISILALKLTYKRKSHFVITLITLWFSLRGTVMYELYDHFTVIIIASSFLSLLFTESNVLYSTETKYGKLFVVYNKSDNLNILINNKTIHGLQNLDPKESMRPLLYFSDKNIFGSLMNNITNKCDISKIGVIGLGNGCICSYGKDNYEFDFYEINPQVVDIAKKFFTFLQNTPSKVNIILGDAREKLLSADDGGYDLIIVDGYQGKNVPANLLTYEAIELYAKKLSDNGIIVMHVTSLMYKTESSIAQIVKKQNIFARVYLGQDEKNEVIDSKLPIINLIKRKFYQLKNMLFSNNASSLETQTDWIVIAKNEDNLKLICPVAQKWRKLSIKLSHGIVSDTLV